MGAAYNAAVRKLLVFLLVVLAAAAVGSVWLSWRTTAPPPAAPVEIVGKRPRAKSASTAAHLPDAAAVAAARASMTGGGRVEVCGPYTLYTDEEAGEIVAACQVLGATLDATFAQRYGVVPVGAPSAAILLFATTASYRAFAEHDGAVRGAYAGYASTARGFVALHAGDQPVAVLATLTHELTHLVSRRTFGRDLPPWLSEGLADGIGDTVSTSGFGALAGFRGAEGQVERLRGGYRIGQAMSLQRLAALERGDFDRATVSYDYEQSALLVRYLLGTETLAPRFRAFLQDLAGGEPYTAEALRQALALSWTELDHGFREWLGVE